MFYVVHAQIDVTLAPTATPTSKRPQRCWFSNTDGVRRGARRRSTVAMATALSCRQPPVDSGRTRATPGGKTREVIRALVGAQGPSPEGRIPFLDAAKSVLASTLRTSRAMDDQFIGAEHIVLGVTFARNDLAVQVLTAMDVDIPALHHIGSAPARRRRRYRPTSRRRRCVDVSNETPRSAIPPGLRQRSAALVATTGCMAPVVQARPLRRSISAFERLSATAT